MSPQSARRPEQKRKEKPTWEPTPTPAFFGEVGPAKARVGGMPTGPVPHCASPTVLMSIRPLSSSTFHPCSHDALRCESLDAATGRLLCHPITNPQTDNP